ncbi:MAG: ferrous iron transport protein A [Candidatus Bathyarchaeota archaeon]|nr:ferrous iron transport protein A [Candidatus Bathyarchaeota archaeon]
MRLSELKPGQEATVTKIENTTTARRRIMDMGLVKGSKVKVICRAPLGDPLEIEIRDYKLSLRKKDAQNILVTEAE